MHFRGQAAKDYAAALQPGDTLLLEREPSNEYDTYAIKVMTPGDGSFHLGYIEKGAAMWIASEMDEGMAFTATVEDLLVDRNTVYPRVNIVEQSDAL
jgi:hypothetical protein